MVGYVFSLMCIYYCHARIQYTDTSCVIDVFTNIYRIDLFQYFVIEIFLHNSSTLIFGTTNRLNMAFPSFYK